MISFPIRHAKRSAKALAIICLAAVAACASVDRAPIALQKTPAAPPPQSIGDLAAAGACIDKLLLDYGPRDLPVLVENLADSTRQFKEGTRDMLVAVGSAMTQRSRAIRPVASAAQALPYTLRGSIGPLERTQLPAGTAAPSSASVLALELTLSSTADTNAGPATASRNTVTLIEGGAGLEGHAELRKFGVSFNMPIRAGAGGVQGLRALTELTTIELLGRFAKVPYWVCFGATTADPEIAAELQGWYDSMAARPAEIIGYFQRQLRLRRVYDGPLDGAVNPQLKEAVARYREALGLSREAKLSLDFFQAYLSTDPHALETRLAPAPAAPTPAAVAEGPLAVHIASTKESQRFAGGEAVQLTVRPSRDAYVYCFYQDENRKFSRVFPNRFQRNSRVASATGLQLPGAMRFEIVMNPRGLPENLSCFATERDVLTQLPTSLNTADLAPLPVATLDHLRSAFLKVTGGALAQDSFQLRSR